MSSDSDIKSVADVFDAMGGVSSMARILATPVSTASEMKRRGRIRAEYWRDIVHAARNLGHPEITADLLADLHARRRKEERSGFGEEERSFAANSEQEGGPDEPKPAGHFSRFKHLRRPHFGSDEEISAHVRALRDEWARR